MDNFEKENKRLKVLIVILLLILLGFGGFYYYTTYVKGDDNDKEVKENNSNIDSALLNNLYDILGINWKYNSYGDCLNYFLSTKDYETNAQKIFSLYAAHYNMDTYRYDDARCGEYCKRSYSCADCRSILKKDADKIINLYNFKNLKLSELPDFDTDYNYVTETPIGACHYNITHDISGKYIDKDSIMIIDKQVVKDYIWPAEETNEIKSQKNQTVIYDFKKNNDNNYYLYDVKVEEN